MTPRFASFASVLTVAIYAIFLPTLVSAESSGQLIVTYVEGTTVSETDTDLFQINGTVFQVVDAPAAAVDLVQASLESNPMIAEVEENGTVEATILPDDTSYGSQDHHDGFAASISSPDAWDRQTGDSSVVVAVIDSGVDTDHPDIAANMWTNTDETPGDADDDDSNGYDDDFYGYDFVDGDGDPNPAPDGIDNDAKNGIDSGVNHGTHVAGIIGAVGNNAEGVSGVVWDTQIMALRGLNDEGSGSYANIALAVAYAVDNGADIINMSLGSFGVSATMDAAIAYANANDVIVFSSMGNNDTEVDTSSSGTTYYPACASEVVGVSALTDAAAAASFTNYGDCTDIAGPGVGIYSTLYTDDPTYSFTTDYGSMSGTSMSTPVVAGVMAMLISEFPSEDPVLLRDILVEDSVAMALSSDYGNGRVDSDAAMDAVDTYITAGPVVTLTGDSSVTLECNVDSYTESGATASDEEDGDVTGSIVTDSSSVDSAVPDSYAVTYTVSDARANETVEEREVIVQDTSNPTAVLTGESVSAILQGDEYTDLGATATDGCDTEVVPVADISVDTTVVGEVTVTYTATDDSGNTDTVTRTVTVVPNPDFVEEEPEVEEPVPEEPADEDESDEEAEEVATVQPKKNNTVLVEYADGSTETVQLFDGAGEKPKVKLSEDTNIIVALKSNGRNLRSWDPATQAFIAKKAIRTKKQSGAKLRVKDVNGDGSIEVIVATQRRGSIRLTSYRLSPSGKLKERSTKKVSGGQQFQLKVNNGKVRILSKNGTVKKKWVVKSNSGLKVAS